MNQTTAPPSAWQQANKPREIEEFLDTYLIRPMGYVVALALRSTPVTPNQVSFLAILAAIGAAWSYTHRDLSGAVLGLAFILLTSALDSADGQLARLTGRTSEAGRTIDGLCDNLSFGSIYLAIYFTQAAQTGHSIALVALSVTAILLHSAQSASAEFARSLFQYYAFGKGNMRRERPEVLLAEIKQSSGFRRLLYRLHLTHSREQRTLLPSSDRLQRAYDDAVEANPALAKPFGRRYYEPNVRFIPHWAWNATNVHKIGIVVTAFFPVWFASGPLHDWGQVWYLGWDVTLSLAMVLLMLGQRRLDANMLAELEALQRESSQA